MGDMRKSAADGRAMLGSRLAALRAAAGYTQETFAPATRFYGRSSIANIERGRQSAPRDFWVRCDELLNADGYFAREHDRLVEQAVAEEMRRFTQHSSQALTARWFSAPQPGKAMSLGSPNGNREALTQVAVVALPHGRYFSGTELDVRVFPAVADGRVLAQLPPGFNNDAFLTRGRRGLVIGAVHERESDYLYGLDTRNARRRLAGPASNARLLIPDAYLLDEVTIGLLWAIVNFDEALLNDDSILAEYITDLGHLADLDRSSAGVASAADLSPTSLMWLGSDFCARHILRNAVHLSDTPAFWTREQRGEEASAWLLFAHKFRYLEQLRERYPTGMTRTFCVPEATVGASPNSERVLVLLVAALMESFGIRCLVTSEPEYAGVDGFVLDSRRRAIIANWLGAEGIWFVDVTDSRTTVREYVDANSYVQAHSAITGATPALRLHELAAYLGLQWSTVTRRCADLAEYGIAGLAEPRSRLLSLAGAERACRYLGDLTPATSR
ncbi:helix-turn-helix domain-containing protein [Catellatospora sp. NPDC049111]|uniref:helix-turn-helix domain-containing protein n=1 Tax=Catellatospora sp. NPDC049111 TaxID=3155271 RepID=UPI003400AF22